MNSLSRRKFLEIGSISTAVLFARKLLPKNRQVSFVEALWAGAIRPNSARVNAKIDHDSAIMRLLVSPNLDLSAPTTSAFYTADSANNRMVGLPITGLMPDTRYYYGIESGGLVDDMNQGTFKTPAIGAQSFSFAFAACAETGSTHPVFDTIRSLNPLFFLHMGDMHYENIAVNECDLFRTAFDTVLNSSTQAALYRQIPIAYMWDDHDFGDNDSDSASPSREAARLTYQEYVPHYPLPAGSADVPIYQSFAIGRIYFILTDLRSERSPKTAVDNANKTMMGSLQKAWFKNELLAANDQYAAIIWLSTVPWIGAADPGSDYWASYTTERQELANFIKDNDISGVVMVSGDAHMIALDDGRNSDYATGGGAAFPVMHAAALDRPGGLRGGPYSHGTFVGPGQFGFMTITDTGGDTVSFTLSGRDVNNNTLVEYSFTRPCCLNQIYLPMIRSH
ncbi:MAG: alkaline phosphatase family protein [Chloroflexi bacterium]|nr:alkaline phosphatase family protein [Chloroflexota bacterium]